MNYAGRSRVAIVSGGALLVLGVREAIRLRDADMPTARGRARQLGIVRIAAGLLLMLEPRLLSGALGISGRDAASTWLPRLVAVREVALGTGAVAASRPPADPWPWLMTIAAVDGAEAVVLAAGLQRRVVDSAGGWAFIAADIGSGSALALRIAKLLKERST